MKETLTFLLVSVLLIAWVTSCGVREQMKDEDLRGHYVTVTMDDERVFECKAVGYGHVRSLFDCKEVSE